MNLLEQIGAQALLNTLMSIQINQEQMMSKQTELQNALTDLKAAVAEQNAAQVAKLTEIADDVEFLRDKMAEGSITPENIETATKAAADLRASVAALKAYDAEIGRAHV